MRETVLLNDGWKYYDGDPAVHAPNNKGTVYMQAKTECRLWGPAAEKYDDRAFAPVTLPHDALIGRTPRPEGNEGLGYFRYHCGWYRRRFVLPEREDGARAYLRFEGVATHAEVYVNGCLAGRSFGGYAPFEVDISCFARFGGENTVSVRVDSASSYEGWWYQGMGIYRDVKLVVTNDARIASDGVFVHPEKQKDTLWRVPVDVEIENHGSRTRTLTVRAEILDGQGTLAARGEAPARVSEWDDCTASLALNVEAPALWRLSDPKLYTCRVTIRENGEILDSETARFGFRTIGFAADGAFLLNGERTYINGVNCHQDFGLTGKVMPPEIAGYRVRLMKEMGANAMRLAHYPHGEAEMNALDENGMLALAETRWFSTEPEAVKQLTALIRRDRNHPCVFLWSVGNEEPLHAEPRGRRIAAELFARVRKLDPTRPLTTVVCHAPERAPVYEACDVLCLNYNLPAYDELRRRHPDKPFLAGEWCATPTTRGWYAPDDPEKGRVFAGDHDPHNGFSAAREDTAAFVRTRTWVAGGFQWVGVEHRGECKWPRICSASGAVDLFLLKKDAYYQNQTLLRTEPRVHILGHWNAPANGAKIVTSLGCDANVSAEAVTSLDCDANTSATGAEAAAGLDCGANVPATGAEAAASLGCGANTSATGAEAAASLDCGANAANGAEAVASVDCGANVSVADAKTAVSLGCGANAPATDAEVAASLGCGANAPADGAEAVTSLGCGINSPAETAASLDCRANASVDGAEAVTSLECGANAPANGAKTVPVWVYARADRVELFLNGASLGIRDTRDGRHAEWQVPYTPGELRAVGYMDTPAPRAATDSNGTPEDEAPDIPKVASDPSETPVCGASVTPCAASNPSGKPVCGMLDTPCAASNPSETPVCGTLDTPCAAGNPGGTPVCGAPVTPCAAGNPGGTSVFGASVTPCAASNPSGTPVCGASVTPCVASHPSGTPVCGASVTPCAASNPSGTPVCGMPVATCTTGKPSGTPVCGASVTPCAASNPSGTPVCGTSVTSCVAGNPSGTSVCGTSVTPCVVECPNGTPVCGASVTPCAVSDPGRTPVCGASVTPCAASNPSGTPVCGTRVTPCAAGNLSGMPVCGTSVTPCVASYPSGTPVCAVSATSQAVNTSECVAPVTPQAASYPGGTPVCEDVRHTTGKPVKLRLTPVEPDMPLFTCECLDEVGRVVPDAAPYVRFRAEGGVRIIATGSDNADSIPPAVPNRQMYMGQIAVYARVSAPGALIAEADGLVPARYEIRA